MTERDTMCMLREARPAGLEPVTSRSRRERDLARALDGDHGLLTVTTQPVPREQRRMVVALAAACLTAVVAGGAAIVSLASPDQSTTSSADGFSYAAPTVLVAYTAAQPKGYTLKTIPAGWVVDEASETHLSLRRSDMPSGGDWLDKIVVTGGYDNMRGPESQQVRINGLAGWLDTDEREFVRVVGYDTGRTVERPKTGHDGALPAPPPGMPEPAATNTGDGKQNRASQNSGPLVGVPVAPSADDAGSATDTMTTLKVTIQLPDGLNWDPSTAVAFASGITVERDAEGSAG